jgi:hypothetical protein
MKKKLKKLALAKETVSLITAPVVGGVITALCTPTWTCPTDPNICQSGKYPC